MGVQVAAIKGRTERERNADSYTIAIESLQKDRNNSSGNCIGSGLYFTGGYSV